MREHLCDFGLSFICERYIYKFVLNKKRKNFQSRKYTVKEMKRKAKDGEKYLQNIYLKRNLNAKYINNPSYSKMKRQLS